MSQIYSENYFWKNVDYELAGFRDNENVFVRIYVVNEQGKHIVPQFAASAKIEQNQDGKISEVDTFSRMIEYAKGHIQFSTALQGISFEDVPLF